MSEEIKNTIVPRLRFPEFMDGEGWTKTKLGEISEIVRGGSPRPIEEYLTNDSNGLNWLKIGDVRADSKFILNTKEKVIKDALSKTREVFPGDLILSNSMSFGRPYILKIKTCIHDGWIAITQIKDSINKDYLYYFILSPLSQIYFLNYSAGSGVQNLNADIIKLLEVVIPTYEEQQKIASCLSSLDDLITAESQKLEAFKALKKGLMQQLFPTEGETVPQLRFGQFSDSGEWENSEIGNYIDLLSGIPLKSEELSDDVSGIPILRGINITEGYIRHSKDIDKYFLSDIEAIKKYLVIENDLVIAMDGSKVGKNVALIKKNDANSILIQRVARIRANEKSDIQYIYQHIFSSKFQKYVDKVNTSSGIPHISAQQIKDFKIGFPSIEEQQKIASCLSSLDELITAQAEKIEELKNHKKGLMQGLFPKL